MIVTWPAACYVWASKARNFRSHTTRPDSNDTHHLYLRFRIDGKKAISRGFSGGKQRIKFAKKKKSLIKVEFEFTSNWGNDFSDTNCTQQFLIKFFVIIPCSAVIYA